MEGRDTHNISLYHRATTHSTRQGAPTAEALTVNWRSLLITYTVTLSTLGIAIAAALDSM